MHVANLNYWCNLKLFSKEWKWILLDVEIYTSPKKEKKSNQFGHTTETDWEKQEKRNYWIDHYSQQSNGNRSFIIMNYDHIHKNVKCFKWNQQHKQHKKTDK